MKVIATKLGYYDHYRRRPGDVFDLLSDKDFSPRWMEKVGEEKKGKASGKAQYQQKELKDLDGESVI